MSTDDQGTVEQLIRALDAILFHATAVGRAVDDDAGELLLAERRLLKAAAERIFREADRLLTLLTERAPSNQV